MTHPQKETTRSQLNTTMGKGSVYQTLRAVSTTTNFNLTTSTSDFAFIYIYGKRGSSVVRHLPLVLEVLGSTPAHGEDNFGVQTRFLECHLQG